MSSFLEAKHLSYVIGVANDRESFEYEVSQHFRMSGVYWGLTSLAVMGREVEADLDVPSIVDWVLQCQHASGGFSGNIGHDPHLLYTLSALQVRLSHLT